jgi:predicted ribosome quality control (RQC) complex YloA/Tae2 family protein
LITDGHPAYVNILTIAFFLLFHLREGMEKALRAAERQAVVTLSKQQTKRSLSSIRKPHWFEKFNWFITSDNYLVVRLANI